MRPSNDLNYCYLSYQLERTNIVGVILKQIVLISLLDSKQFYIISIA